MKFTDNRRSQIETALSRTANRCCSVRQRNYLDRVVVGTFQKRHDINLATAGEKAGKVNAVMLQNPQSTDVQTPVDSVPHLSFQEKNSHHTTGRLRDIPQEQPKTVTNHLRSLSESSGGGVDSSIPIGPERKKRLSIRSKSVHRGFAGIECSKCNKP